MKAFTTIFAAVLSVQAALAGESVKLADYFPPPESKGGWRTLLPDNGLPDATQKAKIRAVAGVDWDKLDAAWRYNASAEGVTGLVVIRRGYIAGEWYRDCDRNKEFDLWSSTKSYISVAFGQLLDDSAKGKLAVGNKLSLDTKVCNADWLPEALPLSDPRRADITLRHLLFATSGIPREGLKIDAALWKKSGFWEIALGTVEGSPWAKLTAEPGTEFNYSTPAIMHVVPIFNRAAGKDLFPFMKERVFSLIGIEKMTWAQQVRGNGKIGPFNGVGGIHTTAREHARFCYLAMHKGNWAGKQIVPASYFDWAWQGTKANPAYGAQWWLAPSHPDAPKDLVKTHGHRFNDGFLVPSLDLVVVRLGEGAKHPSRFEIELLKKVLAAVEK